MATDPKRSYTVAHLIADRLAAAGVEIVFGGHGAAASPLIAAIVQHPRLHWVLVRNETAAPFAASAYAKYYRRLGVCVTTSGPGAAYTVCGMVDALGDSIPVLLLSGLVSRSSIGHEGFQDTRTAQLMHGAGIQFAKAPMTADRFLSLLDSAIRFALERSTPAHLAIPVDVQTTSSDEGPIARLPLQCAVVPRCASTSIEQALHLLLGSRVVILCGLRAAQVRCSAAILELAETLCAPVVTTLDAKGAIDEHHPLALGVDGIFGNPGMAAPRALVSTAAIILAIGVDRCDPVVLDASGQQRVRLVGVDDTLATRLQVYYRVECMLIDTSLEVVLQELTRHLRETLATKPAGPNGKMPLDYSSRLWRYFLQGEWRKQIPLSPRRGSILTKTPYAMVTGRRSLLETASEGNEGDDETRGYSHPRHLLVYLSTKLRPNDVVVVDIGDVTIWAGLCLCFDGQGVRLLSSINMGSMGYAVPAAVAMGVAFQKRQSDGRVFLITGDGGLEMAQQELGTALQQGLSNLIVVVLRNGVLGRVRFGNTGVAGDEILLPDLEKLAKAYDMGFARVQRPADAAAAMEAALRASDCSARRSFLIDLVESPELKAEYATVESTRVPVMRAVAEYLPTEALTATDMELLSIFDLDGDGLISPEEMQVARRVFDSFVMEHRRRPRLSDEAMEEGEDRSIDTVLTAEDREHLLHLLRSGDFFGCVASQKLLVEPLDAPAEVDQETMQVYNLHPHASHPPGTTAHALGSVRDLIEGTIPSVEALSRVPIDAADYIAGFELGTVDGRPPETMGEAVVIHGTAFCTLTGEPAASATQDSPASDQREKSPTTATGQGEGVITGEYYRTVSGRRLSSIAFLGIPEGAVPDYYVSYEVPHVDRWAAPNAVAAEASQTLPGLLWSRLVNDLFLRVGTTNPLFFYGTAMFSQFSATAISHAPVFNENVIANRSKYYREPNMLSRQQAAAVVGLISLAEGIEDTSFRKLMDAHLYRGYFRLYQDQDGAAAAETTPKEDNAPETVGENGGTPNHGRRFEALKQIREELERHPSMLLSHTHALALRHRVQHLGDIHPDTVLRAVHLLSDSRVTNVQLSIHVLRGIETLDHKSEQGS
jgi:thiamine pyrophosphate-dependent acetolactate synthase large subunit-like protein